MDAEKIVESMQLIADDCETDAEALDGMRVDGRQLGVQFGNQLAMIRAITLAVQVIAKEAIELEKTAAEVVEKIEKLKD